jgi:hypothetical protein
MSGQYHNYPNIMSINQTAELFSTSRDWVFEWLRTGKIAELGDVELKLHYHYFKSGYNDRNYWFIKDRMCELFGVLPKIPPT